MCVKQACSRTIQTSGAYRFCARSASPSMRERRVNGAYDALCTREVARHGERVLAQNNKGTLSSLDNFYNNSPEFDFSVVVSR